MTKSTKTVIITAAVLVVLGVVLAVLLILFPEKTDDDTHSHDETITVNVTNKNRENVESVYIKNQTGSYLFTRAEKKVDSKTEFFWTSGEMLGVLQDETIVNSLIGGLAGLSKQPLVEQNAENLEKYSLENPLAEVIITFDDGTSKELFFGRNNPSDTAVYFRAGDNNVMTADKDAVSGVFNDIKDFAELTLTESLSDVNVESVKIERKDLENAVELQYMSEILKDENFVSATSNTHKFTSPFVAEVDAVSGSELYNGLCLLTMSRCVYLEQSAENMEKCGLSDPHTVVKFKLSEKEYTLLIGSEVKREIEGGTAEITGYYAVLEGVNGIFELAKDKAIWRTFTPEKLISKRPLSPYIYYVRNIVVTTADGEFRFDIDSENKAFFYNGSELANSNFRSFYQQLIGSYGEEYYTGEVSGSPVLSVKFVYAEEYSDKYGCEENIVEFYRFDERKNVAVLDGKAIFKVSAIYAERLAENVQRLIKGENVIS